MKKWFAFVALCALLVSAVPVFGETGIARCPANYPAGNRTGLLEHQRQLQAVGGITASPYWLKQGFLCGRSISLRLFEVELPVLPNQLLFKERLRFAEDGSGAKELLLTVNKDTDHVELRVGSSALEMLDRAGISRIIVRNYALDVVGVYERADIQSVFDYFELDECEVLCLQGEDAPMFAHDADGVRRVVIQ